MSILIKLFLFVSIGILLAFILVLFDQERIKKWHILLYILLGIMIIFLPGTILPIAGLIGTPFIVLLDAKHFSWKKLIWVLITVPLACAAAYIFSKFIPFYTIPLFLLLYLLTIQITSSSSKNEINDIHNLLDD